MKRSDLEALGLEKEVIDKVMKLHGDDIEGKKTEIANVKKQLEEANEQLNTAKEQLKDVDTKDGKIADLQKQLDDYAEKETQRKEAEKEAEMTAKILAAFPADKEFTSEYVKNGIVADVKKKMSEDNTLGVKEIFDSLTKDEKGNEIAGIFKNKQHENVNIPATGGGTGGNEGGFPSFF